MLTNFSLKAALVYDLESGLLSRKKNNKPCGRVRPDGYVDFKVYGKRHLAHRLAWLYVHGSWPSKFIDHIDRDKQNNSIANLRDISRSENHRHRPTFKSNTSGVPGVLRHKGKWEVTAFKEHQPYYLGRFSEWFDAVCARKAWDAANPIGA
jgi:hypothetical protein